MTPINARVLRAIQAIANYRTAEAEYERAAQRFQDADNEMHDARMALTVEERPVFTAVFHPEDPS